MAALRGRAPYARARLDALDRTRQRDPRGALTRRRRAVRRRRRPRARSTTSCASTPTLDPMTSGRTPDSRAPRRRDAGLGVRAHATAAPSARVVRRARWRDRGRRHRRGSSTGLRAIVDGVAMKVITWNVNGIRARQHELRAPHRRPKQPDVVCLQEIKAAPDKVPDLLVSAADYSCYWHGRAAIPAWRCSSVTVSSRNVRPFFHPSFDMETVSWWPMIGPVAGRPRSTCRTAARTTTRSCGSSRR